MVQRCRGMYSHCSLFHADLSLTSPNCRRQFSTISNCTTLFVEFELPNCQQIKVYSELRTYMLQLGITVLGPTADKWRGVYSIPHSCSETADPVMQVPTRLAKTKKVIGLVSRILTFRSIVKWKAGNLTSSEVMKKSTEGLINQKESQQGRRIAKCIEVGQATFVNNGTYAQPYLYLLLPPLLQLFVLNSLTLVEKKYCVEYRTRVNWPRNLGFCKTLIAKSS